MKISRVLCLTVCCAFFVCPVQCNSVAGFSTFRNHFSYEDLRKRGYIVDTFAKDAAYFYFIPGRQPSDQLLFGAKNRLFTVPVPAVSEGREVLSWSPPSCVSSQYACPGERDPIGRQFSCGNHIRFVLNYNPKARASTELGLDESGRSTHLLVCGSHAGDPKCQVYRREKPRWLATGRPIDGRGVVSSKLCPTEKNPFYYDEVEDSLFVSGFALSVPALAKFVANETLSLSLYLRESPFFKGQCGSVSFHSIIRYKDKVYLFFNEEAYEEDFNSMSLMSAARKVLFGLRKRRFARVARVCFNDKGSESRWRDQFSTFFKARLLCRDPSGFLFDHLVAVSEEAREERPTDGATDPDPLIRGVFASDDGLTRHHGVCAFRMSAIERGINNGQFVEFQRSPEGNFLRLRKSVYTSTFMACRSRRSSLPIARFAHKYPLKSEPILNTESYPWLSFSADTFNVTVLVVDHSSGQDVLFLGTDTGRVIKLASVPEGPLDSSERHRGKFSVIDSMQLFPSNVAVRSLVLRKGHLVAVSKHEMITTSISHCDSRNTCKACILLGDPHCSWNALTQLCSGDGKKVGSIREGLRYCASVMPNSRLGHGTVSKAVNITFDRLIPRPSGGISSAGLAAAIGVTCSVLGFALGCLVTCLVIKKCRDRLYPRHILDALRQRKQRQPQLGNEKPSAGPRGVRSLAREPAARRETPSNEYDEFLDHRPTPASVPLDKKLNNEMIKNTILASLNKNKSCDNFL